MVRATDDSAKTPVAVYHALRAGTPGGYVSPLDSPVSGHRADVAARFVIAFLFTAFGLFALTLSVVGIYGVLNYTVGQRLREFATRIALGALPSDLLRIVMHDALVMVLAGTGIGAFGALAFGFVLDDHWLKGIGPTDVIALVGAEALIIGVSLLACLGPAARAARADLVELLRAT
jgi:ABC-type antimicrobial peptide transport system permease subunit